MGKFLVWLTHAISSQRVLAPPIQPFVHINPLKMVKSQQQEAIWQSADVIRQLTIAICRF